MRRPSPSLAGPPVRISLLVAFQALIGAALALAPVQSGRLVAGPTPPAPAPVVRLLGGRMAIQAVMIGGAARRPTWRRPALMLGVAADALHAASMVPTALRWPAFRRSALVSAALAGGSGLLGAVTARRAGDR